MKPIVQLLALAAAELVPPQDSLWAIGMVPPAMNLALSPETAVTFGSARVWATPCRSKACMLAVSVLAPLVQLSVASVAVRAPLMANGLSRVRLPLGPPPLMLTPSCLAISRRISATVTRRVTWSRPRMVSELITLPVASVELFWLLSPAPLAGPPSDTLTPAGEPEDCLVSLTKPFARSSAF